jgi:hypothetical protein
VHFDTEVSKLRDRSTVRRYWISKLPKKLCIELEVSSTSGVNIEALRYRSVCTSISIFVNFDIESPFIEYLVELCDQVFEDFDTIVSNIF